MMKNTRKVCFLLAFLMFLSVFNCVPIKEKKVFGVASEERDVFCIDKLSELSSKNDAYLGKEPEINVLGKINRNNVSYLNQKKELKAVVLNLYAGIISQDIGKIFVYSEVTEFYKILGNEVIVGYIHKSDGKKGI